MWPQMSWCMHPPPHDPLLRQPEKSPSFPFVPVSKVWVMLGCDEFHSSHFCPLPFSSGLPNGSIPLDQHQDSMKCQHGAFLKSKEQCLASRHFADLDLWVSSLMLTNQLHALYKMNSKLLTVVRVTVAVQGAACDLFKCVV